MTTRQPGPRAGARWHALLRPRWLVWHAFVVSATVGMFFLGDWQLHRAESGNSLSWGYTFEWPLFAAFTVYFWFKSLRDEVRGHGGATPSGATPSGATPSGATPSGLAATGQSAPDRQPASWDATSWDAASWRATSQQAVPDGTGKPVDRVRATPADGEAYVARLMAEVRGPGRRRGRR